MNQLVFAGRAEKVTAYVAGVPSFKTSYIYMLKVTTRLVAMYSSYRGSTPEESDLVTRYCAAPRVDAVSVERRIRCMAWL